MQESGLGPRDPRKLRLLHVVLIAALIVVALIVLGFAQQYNAREQHRRDEWRECMQRSVKRPGLYEDCGDPP
jgi:hypothetical protein